MNKQEEFERILSKINSSGNLIDLRENEKEMIRFFMKINLEKTSNLYKKFINYVELMKIKIKAGRNLSENKDLEISKENFIKVIENYKK